MIANPARIFNQRRSRGFHGGVAAWSHTDQEIGGEGEERAPDFWGERGKGETRSGFPLPVGCGPPVV